MSAETAELVGILNVTPDSFSDGGKYQTIQSAVARADELFAQGASFVDVGAESTRPGATPMSWDQEWRRLEPVLKHVLGRQNKPISLDSYHPETVERALGYGDVIINDVTGFHNPRMVALAARYRLVCIISHLPMSAFGNIQAAHNGPPLSDIEQVRSELLDRKLTLREAGVPDRHIILDPGIGFGKTPELNQDLLRFAEYVPDDQVMIGYSRKRFLGDERVALAPNLKAGQLAIAYGARYLRVHDVAGHMQLIAGPAPQS